MDEYNQARRSLIEGPLSAGILNPILDKWIWQIRGATEWAADVHSDAVTIQDWEQALDKLREQLEFARDN